MTSEQIDTGLDDLLNQHFAGKVVRKDLTKLVKEGANVPVYVLEYLLGMYCASDDEEIIQDGMETVKHVLAENYVRPDEAEKIKSYIRERGSYKVIDKITVTLNEKRDAYEALLSNLGTKGVQIPDGTVKQYEKLLAGGIWCIITIQYFYDEGQKTSPFLITDLKPIQMPNMDMDALFEGRKSFTEEQWIDVLMRSTGMEPAYLDQRVKWHLLARLIPFVENNYNLCELGPKSTGKSHIYKEISPNSILISGGQTTVANLFFNMGNRTVGLVGFWDIVAFDEVAGINFKDADGVQIMKDYMASGSFARGRANIDALASMVFVGNINQPIEQMVQTGHLLEPFPDAMIDSAFFDRMHAYVPGWEVPKMRPEHFTNRYGLIVDYLAEFLREMRKYSFGDAIDRYFDLGKDLNQRDTIAVRRSVSGFLKLLYPHGEYDKEAVRRCLEYALETRRRVKEQLFKIGGPEFKDVILGYIDKDTGESRIIDVPEYDALPPEDERSNEPSLEVKGAAEAKTSQESAQPVTEAGSDGAVDSRVAIIRALIAEHESSRVEFKSSARWNYRKGGQDPALELAVVKTVAGFMNAKGGTLLIGVDDEGQVLGLDKDYKITPKGNKDGFELWLTTNFMNCLGKTESMGLDVSFTNIDGADVCLIDVNPSSKPVFVNAPKSKIEDEFYVRMNNQTQRLSKAELLDYQKDRWG
jgi:ATP-dependent Lon protease